MNIYYILICNLIFVLLLINTGCKKEEQYVFIPPDKFANIYLELNIYSEIDHDSTFLKEKTNRILSSLLKKYNLTEKDLQYTIELYNKDIAKWIEFYENLIITLEKKYATLN